jgi:NH3-dependent NAD+ synthetase
MTNKKLKVVLAYSGGLDTSIILKWLQTEYDAEVVTFTADLGQGEEVEPARRKAEMLGVKPENIFIEDLREEFVREYVFPTKAITCSARRSRGRSSRSGRSRSRGWWAPMPSAMARPARVTTKFASSSAIMPLSPTSR